MIRFFLLFITLGFFNGVTAQESLKIVLTRAEIEHIFLEQNLELVAEKMNISIADAAIAQARLWENPELTISDVNLWTTSSQREGEDEVIPPVFGSFARNTQFSIELSQLIQTANKRGKLVRMEKVSKDIAIKEFEELLRGLKTELRKIIFETEYYQSYLSSLESQVASLEHLTSRYERQVAAGNYAKSEWLRLQAALFEVENERMEIRTELNRCHKEIKVLLNMPPQVAIEIIPEQHSFQQPEEIQLSRLIEMAYEYRPDLQIAGLQTIFFEKSLAYEKAQRIPDLTIQGNYDRFGGVWKNFIGFGVSIDLPLFNRNQGNIKTARIQIDQSVYQAQMQQNLVRNEIAEAYANYTTGYDFYRKIIFNPILNELDDMRKAYDRNLLERHISMMEFIDFSEAWISNKQTVLNAIKNMAVQHEELQYTVGTDIK